MTQRTLIFQLLCLLLHPIKLLIEHFMDIKNLKPGTGAGSLRIADSDELGDARGLSPCIYASTRRASKSSERVKCKKLRAA